MLQNTPCPWRCAEGCYRHLAEPGETKTGCLITQRSQVQILPPLPGSAGQRPDCQAATGPFDRLLAVRWRDGAPKCGTLRRRLVSIGISVGQMAKIWPSQPASGDIGRVTLSAT